MRTLILFVALGVVAADAQESATSPSPAGDELPIEQIIVTATRREESVTDVPLAVSAYDAEQIELSRVTDILELMRVAPSFHVATGQAESEGVTARIRGVGTNSDNPGLESSVGMYVDGVYRNRATVGFTELGAIERIEVLRGPQGTLFGRNSSAGVVSVITALPDPDGGGYVDMSLGAYNSRRLEAGVSGGVGPNVSARIDTVLFERDGFLEDINYDRSFNDRDRTFVRGQLLFEPSDTVRVRVIGDFTDRDENCCAAVGLIAGPTAAAVNQISQLQTGDPNTVGITFDPYARGATVTENSGYYQAVEEGGFSVEVDADLPFARLVSVTAKRNWETSRQMDIDFATMDMGERPLGDYMLGFETFSQELRLNGQSGRLDWLVGAYFADEQLPYRNGLNFGPAFSFYANSLAGQIATGLGSGFDQFAAVVPQLEAGAAGIAQGAAGIAAGLAPFAPFLPPGLEAPGLSAMLPAYPGFPFDPWPTYERLSGARLEGRIRDAYDQDSRSWALFTHNSLELQNDFELTVGLRYTVEDKSMAASLHSTDQVCRPVGQHLAGYVHTAQAYLAGLGAYEQGVRAYSAELDNLANTLSQVAQELPPGIPGLPEGVAALSQGVAATQAGANALLPGVAQVRAGGAALLSDPDVRRGFGGLAAYGCIPFSDPTKDGNYAGVLDENEVTGTLRLSRAVGDHLLYGGYSRGYKAGGFNMDRSGLSSPILSALATGVAVPASLDQWIFRPETVDSFELGGKFSLDNWAALLDVSLFHEEFQDYQLTAFTGFAFEALNIPEVTSKGVEIEARGAINNAIELFGGVTYADVRFGSAAEHGYRAGRQLTHAPKFTGVGGITMRFPIGPLESTFHVDARYTGEHNTGADLDIEKLQESYTVANARLIFTSQGSPWTVDFWAQNIFDEEYAITVFDAPLQGEGTGPGSTQTFNAYLGDPQLYGVSFRYEF